MNWLHTWTVTTETKLRHCNNDQPGPLNCSGGKAIPSFCRCNHCQEMPTVNKNKCCMQPICRPLMFLNTFVWIEGTSKRLSTTWQTYSSLHQCMKIRQRATLPTDNMSCGSMGILNQVDEKLSRRVVWAIRNLSPIGDDTGFIPSRRITMV